MTPDQLADLLPAQPQCAAQAGTWCARFYEWTKSDFLARSADVIVSKAGSILFIVALAKGQSYSLTSQILPAAQAALDEELTRNDYDAVLFEGLLVAGYRVPPRVRIILDEHNIEHELIQRDGF